LPRQVQALADKNFDILKSNPRHPSIHLKKVSDDLYSARVGRDYRALAFDGGDCLVWFWIDPHHEYDQLIS
jgi:hypothetical protein